MKPRTEVPAVSKPDTMKPRTEVPSVSKPDTMKPRTEVPSVSKPDTMKPRTEVPSVSKPDTMKPRTEVPSVSKPDTMKPQTEVPSMSQPDTMQPRTESSKLQVHVSMSRENEAALNLPFRGVATGDEETGKQKAEAAFGLKDTADITQPTTQKIQVTVVKTKDVALDLPIGYEATGDTLAEVPPCEAETTTKLRHSADTRKHPGPAERKPLESHRARESQAIMYTLCLLYTSPSPRDVEESRMPSSA